MLDRRELDRRPVAADDDQPVGRVLLHPVGEPLGAHRPDHHEELVALLRIEDVLEAPPEHVVDLLETGRHRPRFDRIPLVMEKKIHEIQNREDADHLPIAANNGNRPQVGPLHPLVGLVKRIAERGRHDLPAADILR